MEELLTVEPLLVVELLLLWEERTVVPLCCCRAAELLPELLTVLPLEREVLVLPLEREVPEVVVLPEERRLSCCWTAPLLRVPTCQEFYRKRVMLPCICYRIFHDDRNE